MEKESIYLLVEANMKVNGLMVEFMVWEFINIKMVISILDNGRMGRRKVLECFYLRVEKYIKDNSRMAISMEGVS